MRQIGALVSSATGSIASSARSSGPQLVPILNRGGLPVLFDRKAEQEIPRRLICFFTNPTADHPGNPVLRRAMTERERKVIEMRRDALAQALVPWRPDVDRNLVADAIDGMLGGFGANRRAGPQAAAAMTAGYLEVLGDAPPWAIVAACLLVRRGEAGLHVGYCPNEPEFAKVVRERTAFYAKALSSMKALLAAPVEPPASPQSTAAEQARVEASVADAKQRLGDGLAKWDPPKADPLTLAHNQSLMLREYHAAGIEPVYTSAGALMSLSMARRLAEQSGLTLAHAEKARDLMQDST